MEDLQKLLPGFPRVTPQAPFLQVAPNMNFMHNMLPMQNLQPTGQLEYKVPSAVYVPHNWSQCYVEIQAAALGESPSLLHRFNDRFDR